MQYLFKVLSSCGAGVVIFDTPPLLGLSDASILASKVDGTLIVVDITRAKKKTLEQGKAILAQAGTRVLGCVVNKQRYSHKNTIYSFYKNADKQEEGEELDLEQADPLRQLDVTPCGLGETGTASESALEEPNEEEKHCSNNVNSQVTPSDAFEANSETIKLSQDNRR
jgi:hypothetical protein